VSVGLRQRNQPWVTARAREPTHLVSEAGGTPPAPPTTPVIAATRAFTSPWAAIACLLAAEVLFAFGLIGAGLWILGLVLMGRATAWSQGEKVLGFAVLGTGLPLAYVAAYSLLVNQPGCVMPLGGYCGGFPTSLLALAAVYVALQGFVVWRLVRSARRS
jgi:hypothetical protein